VDVLFDLVPIGPHIRPSTDEVHGAQRGKVLEQLCLCPARSFPQSSTYERNPFP